MNIFNPKDVKIGKDVDKIIYQETYILKFFKNLDSYNKTIKFYSTFNFNFVPKLLDQTVDKLLIKQEYVGNLLSLKSNLPNNWQNQLRKIKNKFMDHNIYIEDLRFLPYSPLIVNNITVKNNKIYIVDLTMTIKADKIYIERKIENLIFQIRIYLVLLKYIPYIFLVLPHILVHSFYLIFNL